jgi:uncharacterized Zn finger protein
MATTDSSAPAHPSTRETRALELYENRGHLIRSIASDTYEVPSCGMQGRRYTVRYGGRAREACTCKDFEFGHICKHLLAVGIMHAARRGGVREVRTLEVVAGDPFKAASRNRAQLRYLEDRLRHELLDDEQRQELRDRVLALRRRLGL